MAGGNSETSNQISLLITLETEFLNKDFIIDKQHIKDIYMCTCEALFLRHLLLETTE